MKAVKYLLVILVGLLILPFSVWAEGEEEVVDDGVTVTAAPAKINVYLFRGEGCPHCAEAEEFFTSMKSQYGDQYKVVSFEVWYDQDNSELMNTVASARGEEVNGVPYIIVGNKSWNGYNESIGEEIMAEITSTYATPEEERYDVGNYVPELLEAASRVKDDGTVVEKEEKSSNDALALIIVVLITGAICFGVYKARKTVGKK